MQNQVSQGIWFWQNAPILVRVAPFVLFILLTAGQGIFGEASQYWVYILKTLIGGWLVLLMWPWVSEMRLKFSWEAVLVGVGVFVMWVGLDGWYPKWGGESGWQPSKLFGSGWAWFFVVGRLLGSSLVVPFLEEVFYRSFLYRYIVRPEFQNVSLGQFSWAGLIGASVVFGLAHYEWLPGILCGLAYQGLVIWKKRLGDAIVAHGITNFLLGLWVIWNGAWHFW